nr:hypothetical protein [Tanacetum cinerariifolium]
MNDDSPTGVASAVREGVTPYVVDMTVEMGKQNSLDDTTVPGSFPPLSTPVSTTTGNVPGVTPYVVDMTVEMGKQNSLDDTTVPGSFPPLSTPVSTTAGNVPGNGIDVFVLVDSIRAISERFANTAYGFFLGKKVAYPVVANFVRNTWGKYGLVHLMFSSSTGLFSFQFNSMDGLDAMLENGPWFIRNNPFILKKWHPDENLLKEDISTVPVLVKLHGAGEKKIMKSNFLSSSGNKKKVVEPTIEISNSNPVDVLNSVDNDGEFGTNGRTNNLVNNEANSSGSSFMNIDNDRELLDNDGNPLVPTGIVESDSEVELVPATANLRIPTSGKDGKSLLSVLHRRTNTNPFDEVSVTKFTYMYEVDKWWVKVEMGGGLVINDSPMNINSGFKKKRSLFHFRCKKRIENILMEDISTVPVLVKLHGVPVTAFSEDGLRAIATKLADVELKDNIVVAMPKITREGHYTCNVRVEYEWKPPRYSSCKVFGHVHEECTMNTGAEYRPITKKSTASSRGNKKSVVEPTIEISNSNPVDVLNSVDNDGEFGTNGRTNNLVNNEANSSGSSFMNIDNDRECASNTPIGAKIDKIDRQIGEGKLRLLDNDGNPLVPTGIVKSDSEVELVPETANLRIPTS